MVRDAAAVESIQAAQAYPSQEKSTHEAQFLVIYLALAKFILQL